jgi:cell wall-associated NlpC family hydrolase
MAPAIESAEHPAEAGVPAQQIPSAAMVAPRFDFGIGFAERPNQRISRAAARRVAALRKIPRAARVAVRRAVKARMVRREARSLVHRRSAGWGRHRTFRHNRHIRTIGSPFGGMSAVLAFARTQIGKRYVSGGEGPGGYDCSGFTKRAYARAGLRLPHSSGAQAARAHSVSRDRARPGDLVVGSGHVGVYMGGGMMIDAGNHRTGVVYRRLYGGLRIKRF